MNKVKTYINTMIDETDIYQQVRKCLISFFVVKKHRLFVDPIDTSTFYIYRFLLIIFTKSFYALHYVNIMNRHYTIVTCRIYLL